MTVSGDEEGLGRGELQRRAVDGVMWNLLNIGVAMPVSFVANLFIARALGVVDYGRLAVLTAFVEILSFVLVGGLGQAVTQYGAKAHASGDSPSVARLLRGYQGLRLTVELPIYALAYAVLADVPGPLRAAAIVIGLVLPAVIGNGAICFAIENRSGTGARLVLAATLVSQPIVVEEVGGQQVLSFADEALIACFAVDVTVDVVKEIASRRPLRAVFLDAGFSSDAARINAEQIFREVSPETEVRTI